jgi:hypothetical protein
VHQRQLYSPMDGIKTISDLKPRIPPNSFSLLLLYTVLRNINKHAKWWLILTCK